MSTSSQAEEQYQEATATCPNLPEVLRTICITDKGNLENDESLYDALTCLKPDNCEVSELHDSNAETSDSNLAICVDIAFPESASDSLEPCDEKKANERSGREGEEATLLGTVTGDEICPANTCVGNESPEGCSSAFSSSSSPSSCSDLNISVSEVVTALQEVKCEFRNAVKDAHCEFVSTVSEVKNELSQALIGTCNPPSDQESSVPGTPACDLGTSSEAVPTVPDEKAGDVDVESIPSSGLEMSSLGLSTLFEKTDDAQRQQCPLVESFDKLAFKEGMSDVAPSAVQSRNVNMYSENAELNAASPTGTMDLEIAEPNKITFEMCSPKLVERSQGNHFKDSIVFDDTKCSESNDEEMINISQEKENSTLLPTCFEETSERAQPTSAPSTPVPSAAGSMRKVLRASGCQGRRVSFPEDDTRLISSYLEPVNPWQQMAGVTVDEIAAAYRSSCERHGTQPLPGVLQQIKALPLVVGGRVECISLRGQRLESGQCEGLEEIFRRVQFKILDLEGCSLEDDTAIPLFDMIEFYDSATQLNISCNSRIGFRGWQVCARMLKRTPSVEYLDARSTNLNETNMPILGRALRLGARLHTLHLENCNLTCRPLTMLTAALKQNDTLSELYLAENRLGVNDCIQLGNLVRANSTLRVLDLRNNNVQDAGCGHVCEGICEQQTLQREKDIKDSNGKKIIKGLHSLILWNNHLTQQSATHLASLLSGSVSLEMINLGRNNLTSEGILRLKASLLRNRSLLRLGLQAARIADEGAVALAEYTADNTVIQHIDLRENPIRVAGLMALAHSLRLNTTITQMDLDSDPKTEPAVELAEQHLALQKEIKEYCQRNLTNSHLQASAGNNSATGAMLKGSDQDSLGVNSVFRKVSLTCETSHRPIQTEGKVESPGREEEKQKYVSPAPSPLPSPSPSPCASPSPSPVPSPLKNRFRVFRVQESSKNSHMSTNSVTPVVCSSAPVSQCGRSMSAGDLNLPPKQPSARPNRFSVGGRFTVTRVTEFTGPSSLPSGQSSSSNTVLTHSTGSVSSPKIVISSPVRVERGFSVDEGFDKQSKLFVGNRGEKVISPLGQGIRSPSDSLPEGPKAQAASLSGHFVRLKSDSDSDDVFVDVGSSNSGSSWQDSFSQRIGGGCLRSGASDSNSTEKDNDSVSSSELTDSGFLDDSVCGSERGGGGSCSPSPSSPHPEGDRDSLLSSSVDSTSQEEAGLVSSASSRTSPHLQTSIPSTISMLPCTMHPLVHPGITEPLKRAPLAAMENGSFDSDSEDSEVTTQSSDSTHSDEVRITAEQYSPRPAWGPKQEPVEEAPHGTEASYNASETPTGTG